MAGLWCCGPVPNAGAVCLWDGLAACPPLMRYFTEHESVGDKQTHRFPMHTCF